MTSIFSHSPTQFSPLDSNRSRAGCTLASIAILLAALSAPSARAQDFVVTNINGVVNRVNSTNGDVSVFASGVGQPRLATFDTGGNLYLTDPSTDTIRRVGAGGGSTTTYATGFNFPFGLAFNAAGNLYVSNVGNGTISVVGPNGGLSTTFATNLNVPTGLAFDALGNLYVGSDQGTISRINSAGGVSLFASGFGSVRGIAFDATGNLYATNESGGTVSRVGDQGGVATVFATGFSTPGGLAFAPNGDLFVANVGGGTISRVGASGGAATTFATGFTNPSGIAFVPGSTGAPEPSTLPLLGMGLAAGASVLGVVRRRKAKIAMYAAAGLLVLGGGAIATPRAAHAQSTLFSNLDASTMNADGTSITAPGPNGVQKAVAFTTGNTAYTLTSLQAALSLDEGLFSGSSILSFGLYSPSTIGGSDPGTLAANLGTNTVSNTFGGSPVIYTFTPSSAVVLDANTRYVLLCDYVSGDDGAWAAINPSVNPTARSGSGFSSPTYRLSTNDGASYGMSGTTNLFALNGTVAPSAAPEPGSLSLLGMGLAGGSGMVATARRRKAKRVA